MSGCPCGDSIDAFFSYDTPKVAVIRDRRLGLTYFGLLFLVFVYIILYLVIYKKRYLMLESPQGIVRTSLYSPPKDSRPALVELPYCITDWRAGSRLNQTDLLDPGDPHPCVWWDAYDVAYPNLEETALLITTSVKTESQSISPDCTLFDPACAYVSKDSAPLYFVADIERFSLLVDHSFSAPIVGVSANSVDLHGRIVNAQGNSFVLSEESSVGIIGMPDLLSISDLLQAAGISSLDQRSSNKSGSGTFRSDVCFIYFFFFFLFLSSSFFFFLLLSIS